MSTNTITALSTPANKMPAPKKACCQMLRNFVAKIASAISRVFQFILPCVFKKKAEAATSLSEADKSLAQIKTDLGAAKKDKEEATKLLAQAKIDSASAAKSKKEADGIEAQAKQTQAEADKKLADAQGKLAEADAALLAAADPTAKVTLVEAQAERQAAADARAEANKLLKKTQDDVAQLQAKANELLDKAKRTGQEADERLVEAARQLEAANTAVAAADAKAAAAKTEEAAAKVRVIPPEKHRPAALKAIDLAADPSSVPTAPVPSDAAPPVHVRAATVQAPRSATEVKGETEPTRIASPERTAALVDAFRATSPERAASKAPTATTGKTPARRWPSLERREALKMADQLKESQGSEEAGAAQSVAPGSYENTKFLVAMPDALDYLSSLKNVKDLDLSQLDLISEAAGKMFNDCKDDLPKIERAQIHLKLINDIEDWHFADKKMPMHTAGLGINPKLVQEIIAFESGNPEKTGFIFIEGKLENDPKVYAAVYKQNSFFVVDFYQEGEARFASLSHNALMKKFKAAGPEFRFIPVVKVEFPAAQVVDV